MTRVYEHGSHRDPAGRVFMEDNRVFRELTGAGHRIRTQIRPHVERLSGEGKVVNTASIPNSAPMTLEHELIPFLSYAHEWPFTLLKKAALLHLELMLDLVPRGFILKDATPANIQFVGLQPKLIDVLSIEPLAEGDPWTGYSDFCDRFLYPLMLRAYKGVPFHAWLRGRMAGIPPEQFSPLFKWTEFWRPGVLSHVKLRSLPHRRWNDPEKLSRSDLRQAGFPRDAITSNVSSLHRLISGLEISFPKQQTSWAHYLDHCTYDAAALEKKRAFVDTMLGRWTPRLVWDVGANTNLFSAVASRHAARVIGFERDETAAEAGVRRLERESVNNVLPLVMDWADPSSGGGWESRELKSLDQRPKPDALLYLALIHHLAVGARVPIEVQLETIAPQARHAIVEFVAPEDAMFKRLALNIDADFSDYSQTVFEEAAGRLFVVDEKAVVGPSRTLYALTARPSSAPFRL